MKVVISRGDSLSHCPPNGTHRCFFKLFAPDHPLNLQPGASKADVMQAMEGYVLEAAELMGRYARQTSTDLP